MSAITSVLKGLLGLEKRAVAVYSVLITVPLRIVVARNWWQRRLYPKTHAHPREREIVRTANNGTITEAEIDEAIFQHRRKHGPDAEDKDRAASSDAAMEQTMRVLWGPAGFD